MKTMKQKKSGGTRFLLMMLLTVSYQQTIFAQLPTADLRRIQPFTAPAGKTVELTISGSHLDNASELRFTHPGITAKPVMLPADDFHPQARIQGSKFTATVSPDVPPGIYEARVVSYLGLSTARPFVVAAADSREVLETGSHATRETAMPVEVNSVITGDVPSRGIDWYQFNAKAGERVLVELTAERIDSRLDGQIVVYNSEGREISRNRDWYGRDPFLEVHPEQDGTFFLAISDILYRGGSEHFYRLSISDKPHIDFIFPPAGEPGSRKTYTVYGRNLPGGSFGKSVYRNGHKLESVEVDIQLPDVPTPPGSFQPGTPRQGLLDGFDYQIANSNSIKIGYATAPVTIEKPELDKQTVSVPTEIAGRFDEPNDEDVFHFHAKKGKTYCIEVIADRMASKVDPSLEVHQITHSKTGETTFKIVTENDDLPSFFSTDNKNAINLNTNDAAATFVAEQDGDYAVTVINQFGGGGTADLYRLAIREPKYDFQLIATTERPLPTGRTGYSVTPLLRRGANWGVRIVAPRQDGFTGDIVITTENLPQGVSAKPLTLSSKTDQGILIISADESAKSWSGEIRIVGKAQISNQAVVREAKFASLIWGHIFADAIRVRSRLTMRMPLGVNEQEAAPVVLSPVEEKEWTVELNQKLEIPIKLTGNGARTGNLTVESHELFGMLRSPPTVNIGEKETEGKLVIDFRPTGNFKVEPGRYQFALLGVGVTQYQHNQPASIEAAAEVKRIEQLVEQIKSEVAQKKAKPDQLVRAEQALAKVTATANSTKKKATPANTKFAVWSKLITVNVTKPADKK
ncbi:PPC domain-containing protein [uncultured Gimesia sp.]|uniref:PPC domain-containing protein n=1 Tax=uncultured Gimesia sp. TaxID=1678688 RepID=UPI0030D8C07F